VLPLPVNPCLHNNSTCYVTQLIIYTGTGIYFYLFALAPITNRFRIVEALSVAVAIVDDVTSDDARFAVESIAAETRAADADVTTASLVKGTRSIEMTVTQLAAIWFIRFYLSTM